MTKLSPELEKLMGFITEKVPPADREGMTKLVTELNDGHLRQDEFSRKMNEIADLRKQLETGKTWVDDNRAYYKEAIAQRDEALQRAKDAEERAAQLKSNANPNGDHRSSVIEDVDMDDPTAVSAAIKKARQDAADARADAIKLSESVTKFTNLLESGELVTKSQFDTEGGKKLDAYGRAMLSIFDTQAKAMEEFGKPISRDLLLKEADKWGGSLERAYEVVTADMRREKDKAIMKEELLKEIRAEQAEAGNPIAPGSPPLQLGPMQARIFAAKTDGDSQIDASIAADGSGRLAHAIAQELRAEGKA
jgi:hypothetical protein